MVRLLVQGSLAFLIVALVGCAFGDLIGDAGLLRSADDTLGPVDGELKRNSRSLLAAPSSTPLPTEDFGHFINASSCPIIMFNNGVFGLVKIYKEEKGDFTLSETFNMTLDRKPSFFTSTCANETDSPRITTLTLTWKDVPVGSLGRSNIDLELKMKVRNENHWIGYGSTLRGIGKQALDLKDSIMTASSGFSFSCSSLKLNSPLPSNTTLITVQLQIERFQIQPFFTENPRKIFADSFDCATWFTIPLWVGVFFLILFSAILALGIMMLFSIKTMDRFENPKGKTITVSAAE